MLRNDPEKSANRAIMKEIACGAGRAVEIFLQARRRFS
jgi:hypothetical protein